MLLALLRLQLEPRRIDQSHLENLLKYYNKLPKEQAHEFDEALYLEQMNLSGFTGKSCHFMPMPAAMDYDYQAQKAQFETKVKQIDTGLQGMTHELAAVKAFLKTYKIPKRGPGPVLMRF